MDISVIMPAYNAEKYIGEALNSALDQEFNGSFEILIADDASTDSTAQVIRDYSDNYPTIVKPVFREHNLGPSSNYHDLSCRATGKYLAFLDADDLWTTKDKLQRQFSFLESNQKYDMLCNSSQLIDYKCVTISSGGGILAL